MPSNSVAAAMVRRPKTLSDGASVGEARATLQNEHVHMVLLVDGATLVGTMVEEDLPSATQDGDLALAWATLRHRTVAPAASLDVAQTQLVEHGLRRLAVVDDKGVLLGLVCLKRSGKGFCSDGDVASRATSRAWSTNCQSAMH